MAKQAKKAKGASLIVATAKEATTAMELVLAGSLISELQADYFGMVRSAVMEGCTFEGMESACPELKEIGAYRSAKSVIRAAKKQKVALVDGEGKPRGKSAISAELKPTGAKGKSRSKKAAPKKTTRTDNIGTVEAALAILKADPKMRKAFAPQIRDLYLTDEVRAFAERKTRSMGKNPRTRVAALAASVKQAQAAGQTAEIAALIQKAA